MEVTNAGFFKRTTQFVFIIGEFHAVSHQHVACTTYACACSVAVFADLKARASYDETSACADVEGVFPVTTSPNNIERIIGREVNMFARFEQTIAEAKHLIYCRASRLHSHQERSNLFVRIDFAGDAHQNVVCVLPRKRFAGNESL